MAHLSNTFAGPNSTLQINGGIVHEALHTVSAHVQLNSGTIARRSKFFDNTVVAVQGGLLEDNAQFYSGATLNVHGGQVAAR